MRHFSFPPSLLLRYHMRCAYETKTNSSCLVRTLFSHSKHLRSNSFFFSLFRLPIQLPYACVAHIYIPTNVLLCITYCRAFSFTHFHLFSQKRTKTTVAIIETENKRKKLHTKFENLVPVLLFIKQHKSLTVRKFSVFEIIGYEIYLCVK